MPSHSAAADATGRDWRAAVTDAWELAEARAAAADVDPHDWHDVPCGDCRACAVDEANKEEGR